jgi:RNAse (barnase) inhibitor barstar
MSIKSRTSALKKFSGIARTDLPVDVIEHIVDALGWRLLPLDGTEVATKDDFLEQCAEVFGLPEWFGMNWDALEECLSELELETPGLLVLWSSWGEFAGAEPEDFATALDILQTAAGTWAQDGVKGGVLFVGDGPTMEVPNI